MLALMAPSVIFVAALFVAPLLLFLFRSVDNEELQRFLPRTTTAVRAGPAAALPDEPVYAALVEDLRALKDTPGVGLLGRRLNYALPGYRGLDHPDGAQPARRRRAVQEGRADRDRSEMGRSGDARRSCASNPAA